LMLNNSAILKSHFETTPHPRGYIFSSGGTTGEPKFLHFSYEEFDFMSDMLAENFKLHGLRPGMMVANLFVAGNLWSSSLCVEKALEKVGAVQLPIGGMCSPDNILYYLKKFRPQVVMGIPSMLVKNAEYFASINEKVEVPMVLYAGEALSEIRQQYLGLHWKTQVFGSAGYASVDAGVIGYQCGHCGPGEHHLFSDLVEMSILEEEAVVTTLARYSMPIKNYRTGDKVAWISDCKCGRLDKRFKLLGRIDNVIQIWSCRLLISDIEACLSEFGIRTFQLKITEAREANVVKEKLTISYERSSRESDLEEILLSLYERSRDVKDTIKYADFKKDLELVERDEIIRNPRTGKISTVVDLRR
jgi:phenylacetate-CoA ligase